MAPARFLLGATHRLWFVCLLALVAPQMAAQAQTAADAAQPPEAVKADTPKDPLGRDTPRGTVLGFLNAAHKGQDQLAREYLETRLTGESTEALAHQLFVVLDARLPARLTQLSDAPQGSRTNPLMPDREVVGTISSTQGDIDIVLDRIQRDKASPVWLFSSRTLQAIPAVYEEINQGRADTVFSRFFSGARVGRVRLFEWVSVLIGIAAIYFVTLLLNRILTALVARVWGRVFKTAKSPTRDILPTPARLLILALAGRWVLSNLTMSLFVRQFWSSAARVVTIAAVVWLLVLLNGEVEQYVRGRLPRANAGAAAALLRLLRRAADLLVIFAGLLATLRLFAIDATPALAGLGVGGIAVALAAQKTLENVIAGASLIFDQAVRVGDALKVGDVLGTVDHIGLRSTRIRTLDRTVVSIPNSQIANASLETLSARDKFWFHPVVALRYETTSEQLHMVVDGIRRLLNEHPLIDRESVRVRFIRLGTFSLDVDVFAYLFASDWNQFLQIQEQLLFGITEIVDRAGTSIAFPSQTMYVAGRQPSLP
jgi:MscS family membrane protein